MSIREIRRCLKTLMRLIKYFLTKQPEANIMQVVSVKVLSTVREQIIPANRTNMLKVIKATDGAR